MSNAYWRKRIEETTQNLFDDKYVDMEKATKSLYSKLTKEITKEVEDFYYKFLDEELTRTEIWTYKHYKDLVQSLNRHMAQLGMKEVNILNGNLEEALRQIYNEVPLPKAIDFGLLDDMRVKQILATTWATKHFSSSVWDNKTKLVNVLKKGITDCVIKGQSKDDLVKLIKLKMGVGFKEADRIVRTELIHTLNAGNVERFKDNGYKKLEIITADDCRRCEYCKSRDGDIVDIDSFDIPPWHPNDRCTVIPVIE